MSDRISAREDGFTLVELLVVMLVGSIVLFGTFQMFDVFSADSSRQLRVTDANDQARRAVDDTVRDLRQAASIQRVDANDLVYAVAESGGYRTQRICLASTGEVYRARSDVAATPYTAGTSCPISSSNWVYATLGKRTSTNSATDPIFRYDTTDPTKVKAVGITLSLSTSGGGQSNRPTTLRSSAIVRRTAGTLQLTGEDATPTCRADGSADLSLGITGIGAVSPVTFVVKTEGGVVLGTGVAGTPLTIPAPSVGSITKVVITATDALGLSKTFEKELVCG